MIIIEPNDLFYRKQKPLCHYFDYNYCYYNALFINFQEKNLKILFPLIIYFLIYFIFKLSSLSCSFFLLLLYLYYLTAYYRYYGYPPMPGTARDRTSHLEILPRNMILQISRDILRTLKLHHTGPVV